MRTYTASGSSNSKLTANSAVSSVLAGNNLAATNWPVGGPVQTAKDAPIPVPEHEALKAGTEVSKAGALTSKPVGGGVGESRLAGV